MSSFNPLNILKNQSELPACQESVASGHRNTVLLLDHIDDAALEHLRRKFTVLLMLTAMPDEVAKIIDNVDVIILRSRIKLTASILSKAKKLKIIARAGAGTDNIDMSTAKKMGIDVFNIPSESARSVAELAIGLSIALARHIVVAHKQLDRGEWKKNELLGFELNNKTLGIVGLGNIGLEIAKIANALGMNVIGCVANMTEERRKIYATMQIKLCNLQETLSQADIICLSVPLTAATNNLIAMDQVKLMKKSARLINISRAGIVNHDDIMLALDKEMIAGFATDVLPSENGINPFIEYKNVIVTSHIGGMTSEAQYRVGQKLILGIDRLLNKDAFNI